MVANFQTQPSQPTREHQHSDTVESPCCWICLDSSSTPEPLTRPCRCPTQSHSGCLARWQVRCAGKLEERHCRFCGTEYPDWQVVLSKELEDPRVVAPELCVFFQSKKVRVQVKPGPKGLPDFTIKLKEQLGLDIKDVALVFKVQCPVTGKEIQLRGSEAWSAAIHCACVQAARHALSLEPHGSHKTSSAC